MGHPVRSMIVNQPAALCASIGIRDHVLGAVFDGFRSARGHESPRLRRGLLAGFPVRYSQGIRHRVSLRISPESEFQMLNIGYLRAEKIFIHKPALTQH